MTMTIMTGIGILMAVLTVVRLAIFAIGESQEYKKIKTDGTEYRICQTTGSQELQSDVAGVQTSQAGTLAVLADGIGKENTGKVCAQISVDTLLDGYLPYKSLNNPEYFFKTSFREANHRIQKTIGERRGGACLAAVFINRQYLYYGLVGDVRVSILRDDELIPVSKGQTVDVLALNAYKDGVLTKNEAVCTMEKKQVWNYLGMDGFREIEFCENPIRLKAGDIILMTTKGIHEVLSWADMEDILLKEMTLKEKADTLVMEADRKKDLDKENGSVLLLRAEVLYEKN